MAPARWEQEVGFYAIILFQFHLINSMSCWQGGNWNWVKKFCITCVNGYFCFISFSIHVLFCTQFFLTQFQFPPCQHDMELIRWELEQDNCMKPYFLFPPCWGHAELLIIPWNRNRNRGPFRRAWGSFCSV